KVKVTLVPDGPLADGITGSTIVQTVDPTVTDFVLDVPLGAYTASAVGLDADGGTTPLLVAQGSVEPAAETPFTFEPTQTGLTCGSAGTDTGIARAFLDVVVPEAPPTP